jgi:cytidylate kinase
LEGNLEEISKELEERDHRDATRLTAPMKPAAGAVIIDNSDTPLAETVERMFETVTSRT